MNGFRDIELLSIYLDGALSPSGAARLESRIKADPDLTRALNDLRTTRDVLRKLPVRKAPRNFTLTRKMVGARPPVPAAYSLFRFSSALATVLLMLTFGFNFLGSQLSFGAGAAAPAFGSGGGCGDACGDQPALQLPFAGAAATEAPAATEPPVIAQAPAATGAPAMEAQPQSTQPSPSAADSARLAGTATSIASLPDETESAPVTVNAAKAGPAAPFFPTGWEILLATIALLSGLGAFIIHRSAKRKWS